MSPILWRRRRADSRAEDVPQQTAAGRGDALPVLRPVLAGFPAKGGLAGLRSRLAAWQPPVAARPGLRPLSLWTGDQDRGGPAAAAPPEAGASLPLVLPWHMAEPMAAGLLGGAGPVPAPGGDRATGGQPHQGGPAHQAGPQGRSSRPAVAVVQRQSIGRHRDGPGRAVAAWPGPQDGGAAGVSLGAVSRPASAARDAARPPSLALSPSGTSMPPLTVQRLTPRPPLTTPTLTNTPPTPVIPPGAPPRP
ncbi:hypothetical protein SAMN05216268_1775, partial [Streptomyces yunnanensis]